MKLAKPFRRPILEFASVSHSDQSLSVVLPVYNAQNSLPHLIQQMLDILPDVAAQFEVLVIDDGSTDQTEEVARDLAIKYPQVRVARHAERLGGDEVIRTGYERTRGKVVIIQQENTAFGQADLKRLWQIHAEQARPSSAMYPARLDSATEDYLTAWSAAFRKKQQALSPLHVDLLAAELAADLAAEDLANNMGPDAEHLRADQPGDQRGRPPAIPRRAFGPQPSRFRPTRR